jgi:hypothetical protein
MSITKAPAIQNSSGDMKDVIMGCLTQYYGFWIGAREGGPVVC